MMIQPFEDLKWALSLIHSGDWEQANPAVFALEGSPVPADPRELDEYRRRLNETLVAARAARCRLAADLVRVQAAQHFASAYQTGTNVPERSSAMTSLPSLV